MANNIYNAGLNQYQPHIDGLRALAVIAVIFFHAGFSFFGGGGFIGVDVFFVISGYLITGIIISDICNSNFAIYDFYERRIRRIFPALFFVMSACVLLSWFWLPPEEMKFFSDSLMAVSTFVANIFFWRTSGYFDISNELKPLIHTWTISAEEQFYILYPLLITYIYKFRKRSTLVVLIVLAIASLILAELFTYIKPVFSFYMLPTRGWEFLIGALAYAYSSSARNVDIHWVAESASLFGLLLIGFSVFLFTDKTPFPSIYTLAPTVGAALVIIFANNGTLVGKVLSSKPLVLIGLISYSAYLWHQPLFAFSRILAAGKPSDTLIFILTFLNLPLSYLTWRFIEKPFRNKNNINTKNFFYIFFFCTCFIFSIGLLGNMYNGFGIIQKEKDNKIISENFIVLGDSHADHLVHGLQKITSGTVLNNSIGGCLPFRNIEVNNMSISMNCTARISAFLDEISKNDSHAILIVSAMGPSYLDATKLNGAQKLINNNIGIELVTNKVVKDRREIYKSGLVTTLNELSKLENTRVFLTLDIPEIGIDYGCAKNSKELLIGEFKLTDLVEKNFSKEECYISRESYNQRVIEYKKLVRQIAASFPKINLFDPADYFCDNLKCYGFNSEYGYLYRDTNHLSNNGSLFYAVNFIKYIQSK